MSNWKKDLLKQIAVVILEYITEGIKNKQSTQHKEERQDVRLEKVFAKAGGSSGFRIYYRRNKE